MRKTIFYILLFSCFISSAQQKFNVYGVILDTKNKPIDNVAIYVEENNKTGTVTDDKGYFELQLPQGNYHLMIQYLGYQPRRIPLNLTQNRYLKINLKEINTVLNTIELKVNISTRKQLAKYIGFEKLKIKDIEKVPVLLGEKDVLKAVQILPGVSAVHESSTAFSVHGGTSDQNLILLDGATVYHPSHLFGFFSVFIPEAVSHLNFYKTSIPSAYGSRLSSILAVQTKAPDKEKYHYGAGIGIISAHAFAEGPLIRNKLSFLVSARRTYADLYMPYLPYDDIKDVKANFYDANLRLDYQINSKSKISISAYKGRDKFVPDSTYTIDWGNEILSINYQNQFNPNWRANTLLNISKYDYDFHIAENIDHQDYNFALSASIINRNFKQNFDYKINKKNEINFGLDVNYYTISPEKIQNNINDAYLQNQITRNAAETSLFIGHQTKIGKKLKIKYGLRSTLFSRLGPETFYKLNGYGEITDTLTAKKFRSVKNYYKFAPRISVNYEVAKNLNIKAGYDKTYQFLHFLFNDATTTPTDLWIPSGINLKPQESDQISLEIAKSFGEKFYLSLGGYYREMKNVTDYQIGTTLSLSSLIEADLLQGIGKSYGLEILLKKSIGKFTTSASYTYSKTEKKFDLINEGKWYPSAVDRPHDFNWLGEYKLSDRSSLSAQWIYYSGRPITFPAGTYELNGEVILFFSHRNANRLPDYHRLDLSYTLRSKKFKEIDGKKIPKKYQSTWNFSIYNVYARENTYLIKFKYDEQTEKINAYKVTLFKFIPSISYYIRF